METRVKDNSDGKIGGSGCWDSGVEVSVKVYGKAGRLLLLWMKSHKTLWLSYFTGGLLKQTEVNLPRVWQTYASTLNFPVGSPKLLISLLGG